MADAFFDRLDSAVASHGAFCVGLDPSADVLARWGLDDDAGGCERVGRTTIDAVTDVAAIAKCQVAFFERHGAAGYRALERVLAHARSAGILVIGDAKRGDVSPTNAGYAEAWLTDGSPLRVDALTVSCYLGARALLPAFEQAHESGRGVFAVAASSNDEGRALQSARMDDGMSVEGALLIELGAITRELDGDGAASRCIGAVIGANRRPVGIEQFDGPVLIPGLGAQGHDVREVAELRATLRHDAVAVNVSHGVLEHGPSPDALRAAATRYADALRRA